MKKEKLYLHYDEEGDMLEIRVGKPTISFMRDIGRDIFERIDEKTGKIKGFTIFNFKKRTEKKSISVTLPLKREIRELIE
ncbi:DUF2283 domain-containing protein [Candidatus Woesearchaeota archaeon]|nr:DUF2283 domain-containing protein [Candidatus Woesearchaeota archaeon]